jgi:hypothetical protein
VRLRAQVSGVLGIPLVVLLLSSCASSSTADSCVTVRDAYGVWLDAGARSLDHSSSDADEALLLAAGNALRTARREESKPSFVEVVTAVTSVEQARSTGELTSDDLDVLHDAFLALGEECAVAGVEGWPGP